MTCSSCDAPLPHGAKFCPECGAPAAVRCTACNALLPPQAKFCSECGRPATGPAMPTPPQPAVAERRVTSVLFGDLAGFTTLSESRDPEEVRELLSCYFSTARDIVSRYGGTIEKYIGDAVMAVWGVPTAHEDDAERAVRAGLDLTDAVAGFGESVGAPGLAMRVGVVTGEVAVTLGATDQGMVAGDAVNTAARVQGKAEPGTVWVDEQTRALAGAAIDFVDAGSHELKGKADPAALFAARAVNRSTAGERGSDRVQAALVGRRRELQLVRDTLHLTGETGRPRLLVVAGDAGVGKTRLAWELRKYVEGLSATVLWHWGRCLSYGSGVAFSALSAAVRGRIGAGEDDGDAEVRSRLAETLAQYVPDEIERSWLTPRMAALLLSDTAGYDRQDLFGAWLTFFERLSQGDGEQIVWVIDDAHHADDGLLDFAEYVAAVARVPLLVVLLTRPELLARRPQLAATRGATVLGLDPLADPDAGALLDLLVEGLPRELRAALVARAEGNPLYAIETVRSMHDQGLAVDGPVRAPGALRLADGVTTERLRTLAAPTSLQVLIASRLDLLPETHRRVLATAAVLGQTFTLDGLAALTGRPSDELQELLLELTARDLVTRITDRLASDQGQYAFVQAVVRTVAYQIQSRRDRLAMHLAAVDYLRPLADGDGEIVGVIAEHLGDAVELIGFDDPRGPALRSELLAWLERSARRATAVGALPEALVAYGRATALAEDSVTAIRLRLAGAEVAVDRGDFDAIVRHVEPLLAADGPFASVLTSDDRARAVAAAVRALRVDGDARRARESVAAYLVDDDLWAELSPSTAASLARAVTLLIGWEGVGYAEQRRWALRTLSYAEASGDLSSIAMALNALVVAESMSGHLEHLALPLLDHFTQFCRRHRLTGPLSFALGNQASLLIGTDVSASIAAGYEALSAAEQAGDTDGATFAGVVLVGGLRLAGRWDEIGAVWERPYTDGSFGAMQERAMRRLELLVLALARGDEPEHVQLDTPVATTEFSWSVVYDSVATLTATAGGADDAAHAVQMLLAQSQRAIAIFGGMEECGTHVPPLVVDTALGLRDLLFARAALAIIEGQPAGRRSPVTSAQLLRLRGTVEAVDPASTADPAAVERDLRRGIEALDRLAIAPYRARAQAVLAGWLILQGRDVEAAQEQAAARATFVGLGAHGWLRELDDAAHGVDATTGRSISAAG